MPTKLGTDYHPKMAVENFDIAQAFMNLSSQLNAQNETLNHVQTQLEHVTTMMNTLETSPPRSGGSIKGSMRENFIGRWCRARPTPPIGERDLGEYDDTIMRLVRVEAPPFDGRFDPKVFLDWLSEMDTYFDWYDMLEAQRVQFSKMKLMV